MAQKGFRTYENAEKFWATKQKQGYDAKVSTVKLKTTRKWVVIYTKKRKKK